VSKSGDAEKPSPAWLEPGGDRGARVRRSKKSEDKLALRLEGRRLPGSGNKPWSRFDKTTARGDVGIKGFHLEHKESEDESIGIKRKWLHKVEAGARRVMKDPGLVMKFVRPVGQDDEEYVIIPLDVFERLLRELGILDVD
jgi:hypothetical protein